MATIDVTDPAREVLNQAPPLQPINLFEVDLALREALEREGGGWGVDRAREAGAVAGSRRDARAQPPRRAQRADPAHARPLRQPDRRGRARPLVAPPAARRDRAGDPRPAVARGREGRTSSARRCSRCTETANDGVMCPVSMTYAAIPALRDAAPDLAAEWEPRLTKPDYENGALAGMAMTERQGGSDVRANITRAEPVGDGVYEIHGHKWFCSYPPCDVFLVLAQAPGRLCRASSSSAALGWSSSDSRTSSARARCRRARSSSAASRARLIGEEGRGVPAIIRMVNHTRLDCLLGSTTGLRRGTLEAIHHARHRSAFGSAAGRPAGDAQRARRPGGRVRGRDGHARCAWPAATTTTPDGAFRRFATAVMKYWVAKRGPGARGRGARVPRRQRLRRGLRDAAAVPRRAARTRSGRAPATSPRSTSCGRWSRSRPGCRRSWPSASSRRAPTRGSTRTSPRSASTRRRCSATRARATRSASTTASSRRGGWSRTSRSRSRARSLVRHSPPAVADAFCATRLAGDGGRVYGTLPAGRRRRRRSSSARSRYERTGHLRGDGADRADHPEPPRARQRDHAQPRHRARALRRARRPRSRPSTCCSCPGNGKGFCGGYDLVESAEGQGVWDRRCPAPPGSPLDPVVMRREPRSRPAPGTRWSTTR